MSTTVAAPRTGVGDRRGDWHSSVVYLLDVNVLIALLDPLHTHHERAHAWFTSDVSEWASCAVTEIGYVRIVSHRRYANAMPSPGAAAVLLAKLCARPEHHFWDGDVSLLDAAVVDAEHLLTSSQITDSYLLALAVRHGGQLATFDKRLVTNAVHGGRDALHVIA